MRVLFLMGCIGLALSLQAQTPSAKKTPPLTVAEPETVGMSSSRLARIDSMLEESVAEGQIPGAVALIARNGRIVYHKAFGRADTGTGRRQQTDDIFRIASQTKAITATAVMMLWEEGKFQLDDPISRYIPEFRDPQVLQSFRYSDTSYTTRPADREITIRDLLTHTSGLGYGAIDGDERMKMIYQKAQASELFTTGGVRIGDFVKRLAELPLHHNPGERYTYSFGLDVLGYLVEIRSGMPFDRFLRERIFDPLGMDDTWFYLPGDRAGRLVDVQHKVDGQWERYPVTSYDPDYPVKGARTFFGGGAGLSSTAEDYATFLQLYLNGGELNGVRILSRTTIATMMENQSGNLFGGDEEDYGLAFSLVAGGGVAKGGLGSEGTFVWGGYFNTQYFADPAEGIVGILLKQTQGNTGDQTGWKFRQMVGAAVDD